MLQDIGGEIYKTWGDEQRRDEIAKLVQGYKTGLPLEILCMVATSIAGNPVKAKKHLKALMTIKERKAGIAKAGANEEAQALIRSYLI